MAKIQTGFSDAVNTFNLDGLDYPKNRYEIFYRGKEILPDGSINKDKIQVGIRSFDDKSVVIQKPIGVRYWTNSSDVAFTDLNALVGELITFVGFNTPQVGGGDDVIIESVLSNGGTIAIPNDVSMYSYLRFEVAGAGLSNVSVSDHVKTTEMSNARVAMHHDDATGYIFFDINSAGNLATLTSTLSFSGSATYRLIGVKNLLITDSADRLGVPVLRWLSTIETSPNQVLVQDTPTLIPISGQPFREYNLNGKASLDIVNNWIDVSGLSKDCWMTVRVTYQGVTGAADMIPSVRAIPDRNALGTFFTVHGQSSRQKNGRTSSYITELFKGDADVLQISLETDANETLKVVSISIKMEDVDN